MADNHFTFLGYRDYTLRQTEAGEVIEPVTGSGLGLLRSDPPLGKAPEVLSAEASAKAHEANILVLTKANSRSTVHRAAHLDYVVTTLLADPGLRERMGAHSRRRFEAEFTWERIGSQYEDALLRALRRHGRPSAPPSAPVIPLDEHATHRTPQGVHA